MLLLLTEPGSPATAADIRKRLAGRYPLDGIEITLQTVRDDLRLLRGIGFPVVALKDDGEEVDCEEHDDATGRFKNLRWALRDPKRLPELLPEGIARPCAADVIALDLLRSLLGQCSPAGFWLAGTTRRLLDEVSCLTERNRKSAPKSARLRVRLLVASAEAAGIARLAPGLRIVPGESAEGFVRMEFEAPEEEAERLVLSMGEHALVETPASLKNRVARRLREASARYADTAAATPTIRKRSAP